MPETFTQPVNLDRIVTVRKADPADKLLNKRFDFTVGSGADTVPGEDGQIRYFRSVKDREGGAFPQERYPGGWYMADVNSFFPGAVWLAYRDRNGFNIRENFSQLQDYDTITVHAKLGNSYNGGPWAMQGVINIPSSVITEDPDYIRLDIRGWGYVGGPLPETASMTRLGLSSYIGEGAHVEFIRPGYSQGFTERKSWAERIDTGTGEEVRESGKPVPVHFATFRMRYDNDMVNKLTTEGRLEDDSGEWDIVGLTELGRRRYLDVECRRVGN